MCIPFSSKRKSSASLSSRASTLNQGKSDAEGIDANKELKEEKTQSDEMRLSEVLRALGKTPNAAMAVKIDKENSVKTDRDERKQSGNRNSMLDDTMYDIYELRNSARSKKKVAGLTPAKTQTFSNESAVPSPGNKCYQAGKFSTESAETVNDEDFAEPNAENFMANLTDIEYVTHDMIRTISIAKELPLPIAIENHPPDFYLTANLDTLEKQQHYGWQSLQANTFLSNVLCLPTEKEKEPVPTAKEKERVPTAKEKERVPTAKEKERVPTAKEKERVPTVKEKRTKVTFLPKETMMAFREKEEECKKFLKSGRCTPDVLRLGKAAIGPTKAPLKTPKHAIFFSQKGIICGREHDGKYHLSISNADTPERDLGRVIGGHPLKKASDALVAHLRPQSGQEIIPFKFFEKCYVVKII